MAFSKIAGFDVTPPRPSSSTSRFNSPLVIRLRRMKSSQTDCPYCLSAATGFAATAESDGGCMTILRSGRCLGVALLDCGDLGKTPHVSCLRGVAGGDEHANEIAGQGGAD